MTIKVIHELIDRSMLHCSGIVIVLNVCYSVSYGSPYTTNISVANMLTCAQCSHHVAPHQATRLQSLLITICCSHSDIAISSSFSSYHLLWRAVYGLLFIALCSRFLLTACCFFFLLAVAACCLLLLPAVASYCLLLILAVSSSCLLLLLSVSPYCLLLLLKVTP